jgi:GNAT superfamily N-acetyltransferase
MSLDFRVYRDDDGDAVIALWNVCDLLRPYHNARRELDFVRDATDAELFLGVEEGRLAGSVMVGHDGHRAWMYRVAVDPAMRGRGHGKALVARAEAWAIARRVPRLMLLVRDDNVDVATFYERLGYERLPRLVLSKSFTESDKPAADAHIDLVVTYLEMTAPPTRPSLPTPAGVHLALLRVGAPSPAYYRFLYEAVGNPWVWWERKLLDDDALQAVIQDPTIDLYVLYVEGAPAGYAEIDRRAQPEVALAYFGLMPGYIGRGLGWYLLNWAIDTAWTGGTQRLTVDTCTLDHPRALQTYQRAGFHPYRQEHKTILDPRLTGRTRMHFEPRRP